MLRLLPYIDLIGALVMKYKSAHKARYSKLRYLGVCSSVPHPGSFLACVIQLVSTVRKSGPMISTVVRNAVSCHSARQGAISLASGTATVTAQ